MSCRNGQSSRIVILYEKRVLTIFFEMPFRGILYTFRCLIIMGFTHTLIESWPIIPLRLQSTGFSRLFFLYQELSLGPYILELEVPLFVLRAAGWPFITMPLKGNPIIALGSLTHRSEGTAKCGLEMLSEHITFPSCLFRCWEVHLGENLDCYFPAGHPFLGDVASVCSVFLSSAKGQVRQCPCY